MPSSWWNYSKNAQGDERDLRFIRILLVEDDEDDYVLLHRLLAEVSSVQYEITWSRTYDAALVELDKGVYDVCLLDYQLGSKNGLDILSEVKESAKTPPIIILTGQGDYLIDLKAMEYGAADYIVKDQMSGHLLERAIRYSIDRKKSRDALQESEKQQKHLASALLRVQENERRILAAELHDDLGQLLMAIKFHIESVLVRMNPHEGDASDLRSLIPNIQDAVERVRNMYTNLMPTVLDDLGIVATLRWFCREFQNDHPAIDVQPEFEVEEQDISADLKLVIFRIVQEAFKNVADHSGAHRANVSLAGREGRLWLDVYDDGSGFDLPRAMNETCTTCGLGLMSMKRRAELSGGAFQIESAGGRGTFISVQWPLEQS